MLESTLIPILLTYPMSGVRDSASTPIDFNIAADIGMFPLEYYTNRNCRGLKNALKKDLEDANTSQNFISNVNGRHQAN